MLEETQLIHNLAAVLCGGVVKGRSTAHAVLKELENMSLLKIEKGTQLGVRRVIVHDLLVDVAVGLAEGMPTRLTGWEDKIEAQFQGATEDANIVEPGGHRLTLDVLSRETGKQLFYLEVFAGPKTFG